MKRECSRMAAHPVCWQTLTMCLVLMVGFAECGGAAAKDLPRLNTLKSTCASYPVPSPSGVSEHSIIRPSKISCRASDGGGFDHCAAREGAASVRNDVANWAEDYCGQARMNNKAEVEPQ